MLNRLRLLCSIGALALVGAPGAQARAAEKPAQTEESPARTSLVPSAPGAAAYQSISLVGRRERETDVLAADVAAELARAVSAAHAPPLVHDARLDRLAGDLALWSATKPLPPLEAIAFLQAHYGVVEQPGPDLILARGSEEREVLRGLRALLRESLAKQPSRRWGVGASHGLDGLTLVVAIQDQQIDLGFVPRRVPGHASVAISGSLLGRFTDPELIVTVPSGAVRRQKLPYRQAHFDTHLDTDAGPGTYQVEIVGTDHRGPAVLANFPVHCDVDPPARIQVVAANAVVQATRPEESEQELLSLVNRARGAAHLKPLVLDARLSQVARSHSAEMARTGRVEHVSPRSGSVVERLKAAHLEATAVAENVGQNYSATQIHNGFMSSPGHRGNVLNQDVTHVGLGVAAGQDGALFFTEVFIAWK